MARELSSYRDRPWMLFFERTRTQIPRRRVLATGVVEHLDVLEQLCPGEVRLEEVRLLQICLSQFNPHLRILHSPHVPRLHGWPKNRERHFVGHFSIDVIDDAPRLWSFSSVIGISGIGERRIPIRLDKFANTIYVRAQTL